MRYIPQIRAATESGRLVVPPEWGGIPGTAFGGFVAAAAVDAAMHSAELPHPLSLHGRYFRPVLVGQPTELRLTHDHRGRRFESISVDLVAADRLLAQFSLQLGNGEESVYRSTNVEPPPTRDDWYVVADLFAEHGQERFGAMEHVRFQGAEVESDEGEVHLAGRWPVAAGPAEAARAAVMPIDNYVAPATWNVHGDLGPGPDVPVILPSIDLTVWFLDLEIEDGWLESRTVIPAAMAGTATGRTEVWQASRLVAIGTSMVMQVPNPAS